MALKASLLDSRTTPNHEHRAFLAAVYEGSGFRACRAFNAFKALGLLGL